MDERDDEDDNRDLTRFPLSLDDISKLAMVIKLIREQLPSMTPAHLRCAAAVLRALERLPTTTPGIHMTFGFVQPSNSGNYGWADLFISESEFRLGVGEHFYDPGVGGDTESRVSFEAFAGGDSADGDIDDWLPLAETISAEGEVSAEDDSDYDAIDWSSETERDQMGEPQPPADSGKTD